MRKYILLMFSLLLCLNSVSARRRSVTRAGRRGGGRDVTPINTNISGTINTVETKLEDTMTVHKFSENKNTPAPTTDSTAQRICYKYVVDRLKKYCKDKKNCTNATEVYASLDFSEPYKVNDVEVANEIYCTNFIETAVNKLWDSYNAYANNEEKNCNIALARTMAAEACYRHALANQNNKVVISDFKDKCGSDKIQNYYKRIANIDKNKELDEDTKTKINDRDDLDKYFDNIGNIGFSNIGAYVDRLLSLKFDFKTNEYPRELVQLVNSLKSEGNMMCGEKNYSQLYDTNFQLFDKTGALGKAIDNKGILAGSRDYFLDQVSTFTGTDNEEKRKKEGLKFTKDEIEKRKAKKQKEGEGQKNPPVE